MKPKTDWRHHFRWYRALALCVLAFTLISLSLIYPSLPELMQQNFHIDGSFRGFSSKVHLWVLPAAGALICFAAYKDSVNKQRQNRERDSRSETEHDHDMLSATWFAAALANIGVANVLFIYVAEAHSWWYPDVRALFIYPIVIFIGMILYFSRA
ncbi:hypothetical protein FM042_05280 [Aliidiomarina halalkaliphila]|uniref:DUF1648 domain-containing protein n=1 Tax=Aliidiomarina halalkaliphila TaxID=2593535 RepID=A0A552X5G5_9GAMM|nr:hypothetical protein [Aliidiomarina halalkaliphila]TRW50248.1 hypothetical protein FM042_05280 [Aliidiomarina halalkaliphila]